MSFDEQLIEASGKLDLVWIKSLIELGANAQAVIRTNKKAWYDGDTHSALLSAVHAMSPAEKDLEKWKNWADVLNLLIENGADPNIKYY